MIACKKNKMPAHVKISVLCMILYALSYVSRKAVDSNANELMAFFSKSKSEIGFVGTMFFIAYAVGQVFHGAMCKKYNPQYTVFIACVIGAVSNFIIGILPKNAFVVLNFVWLLNGFSMAMLWPSVILLVSRVMTKAQKKKAMLFLTLPVAMGTFLSKGLSAITSYIGNFKLMFFISSIPMAIIGFIWLFSVPKLSKKCLNDKRAEEQESCHLQQAKGFREKKKGFPKRFITSFIFMAFIAISCNLLKDGVDFWTPTILREEFNLPNYLSVTISMVLPLVAVFGGIFAVKLHKKLNSIFRFLLILFSGVLILISTIFGLFNTGIIILIVILLALTMFFMQAINNVVTSIYPLTSYGVNAGSIAGFIDGFCYVGSAIGTYGLGSVADTIGWRGVFIILIAVSIGVFVSLLIFNLINNAKIKKID